MSEENKLDTEVIDDKEFKITKKVSVGHIVTILVSIMSIVWWGAAIERKIAILELRIQHHTSA